MAQTGFTPIKLYYSITPGGAPAAASLEAGELAVNIKDGKLFYKSDAGVVKVLADSSTATGNLPGGSTGSIVYQASIGVTTYLNLAAQGGLLFAGPTAPQYLNLGTTGWILTAGATAPAYVDPSAVSVGYASVAGGAYDILGGGVNRIVYQDGTDSTAFVAAPTIPGYVLSWNGSAFAWVAAPASTTAIDLVGGTAGSIPYQVGPSDTAFTVPGTVGYILTSGGTAAPTWTDPSSLSVSYAATAGFATSAGSAGSADTANDIAGGTANQIVYQSAPGTTDFLPTGVAGQVLTSQGPASPPVWQDQVPAVTKAFVYYMAQF